MHNYYFINMDAKIIFMFLLSFGLCVDGRSNETYFDIETNISVSLSVQPLEVRQSMPLTFCAALCSKHSQCCSAAYSTDDMGCRLYPCCASQTVLETVDMHLRKRPHQGVDLPTDCSELPPGSASGVYTISPSDTLQFDVYCDMSVECGNGWTVVQRRFDGTVNFNLDWEAYKAGFGDIKKEFWIGNNILNIMTNLKRYILRFDMDDLNGTTAFAEYDTFVVANESLKFELTIDGYSGTAGDSMTGTRSLNGMKFSTFDQDNDGSVSLHCAANSRRGAWWFKSCGRVNANGPYQTPGTAGFDTMYFRSFKRETSLKSISMKIKPF